MKAMILMGLFGLSAGSLFAQELRFSGDSLSLVDVMKDAKGVYTGEFYSTGMEGTAGATKVINQRSQVYITKDFVGSKIGPVLCDFFLTGWLTGKAESVPELRKPYILFTSSEKKEPFYPLRHPALRYSSSEVYHFEVTKILPATSDNLNEVRRLLRERSPQQNAVSSDSTSTSLSTPAITPLLARPKATLPESRNLPAATLHYQQRVRESVGPC